MIGLMKICFLVYLTVLWRPWFERWLRILVLPLFVWVMAFFLTELLMLAPVTHDEISRALFIWNNNDAQMIGLTLYPVNGFVKYSSV